MRKRFLVLIVLALIIVPTLSVIAQERDTIVEVSFVPDPAMEALIPIASTVNIRYGECEDAQISVEFDEYTNYRFTENNPGDSEIFSIKNADVIDPDLGVYETTFEIEFKPTPWWMTPEPGTLYGAIGYVGISCGGEDIVPLGRYVMGTRLIPWQNYLPIIINQ